MILTQLRLLIGALFLSGLALSPLTAHSQPGLGIILGSPTGISFKYELNEKNFIDGALAWTSRVNLYAHTTYLWNHGRLFDVDGHPFEAYYGLGGRLRFWDKDHGRFNRQDDDEVTFGARLPVGLRTFVARNKIEIFGEISLQMDVVPSTSAGVGVGVGARYSF